MRVTEKHKLPAGVSDSICGSDTLETCRLPLTRLSAETGPSEELVANIMMSERVSILVGVSVQTLPSLVLLGFPFSI